MIDRGALLSRAPFVFGRGLLQFLILFALLAIVALFVSGALSDLACAGSSVNPPNGVGISAILLSSATCG